MFNNTLFIKIKHKIINFVLMKMSIYIKLYSLSWKMQRSEMGKTTMVKLCIFYDSSSTFQPWWYCNRISITFYYKTELGFASHEKIDSVPKKSNFVVDIHYLQMSCTPRSWWDNTVLQLTSVDQTVRSCNVINRFIVLRSNRTIFSNWNRYAEVFFDFQQIL